ncbi:MAG TPA: helix-turn-helix transcriptional regulator [Polyangia bacterium]|jgi:transcriptional regulator with XRE-family HTH domain
MTQQAPSDRLRAARERLVLTPEEVANQIGLSANWYYDLEAYPDEIVSTVSLAHLRLLGQALQLEPATILTGEAAPSTAHLEFPDVARGLQQKMDAEGLDAETLGERVGWTISRVLVDPQELWNFNVTGFRDVCAAAGVDWLAALPRLP